MESTSDISTPLLPDEGAGGTARWRADLRDLARIAGEASGLDTRKLRPADTLVVRTAHSFYTFRFTDPASGEAIAEGSGSYLKEPTPARLVGTTLSGRGTTVTCGRVLVGFKLVVNGPDGDIITSCVRALSVNGMPWIQEGHPQ